MQRTLETTQWQESMMSVKVVFATGEKTKCNFKKQIVTAGFCGQKAKHLDLEKGCVFSIWISPSFPTFQYKFLQFFNFSIRILPSFSIFQYEFLPVFQFFNMNSPPVFQLFNVVTLYWIIKINNLRLNIKYCEMLIPFWHFLNKENILYAPLVWQHVPWRILLVLSSCAFI